MSQKEKTGRTKRVPTEITGRFADSLIDYVAAEMNRSGKSQKAIAEDMGVTDSMLSSWMSDSATPTIDSIVKIADYFNTSTDALLGRKDYSDIPLEAGAVLQQCGLPVSLFQRIRTFTEEQKVAIRLLFFSKAFPSFLESIIRCNMAYQKERDLVLRAEAQQEKDISDILVKIPLPQRIDVAGMLYGYSSLCQYVMDSADDEANHAVTSLQEAATAIGHDLVKKSKSQAKRKGVEDWQKEQDALIARFIETMREEESQNGNDNQT